MRPELLPKISIVIPCLNKVKYINQTLKSIFDQTYSNFEVIVQDGGSTDGTLKVLQKYAKLYPKKFFLQTKKDKGQLDAINTGLRKARGEVLTFINADDFYNPGVFESIAQAYIKYPNSLWYAGAGTVVNAYGDPIAEPVSFYKNLLLRLSRFSLLLITNYFIQPSVFITKRAFKDFGPFEGKDGVVMEYSYWLKLGKRQMPHLAPGILSNFRLSEDSLTGSMSKKILKEDYRLATRYTTNKIILGLHQMHNLGRLFITKILWK